MVLEYLHNGDLKHFLTVSDVLCVHLGVKDFLKQANPRPIKQLVKYLIDIAMGMHYISERRLVHRVRNGGFLCEQYYSFIFQSAELYLKLVDSKGWHVWGDLLPAIYMNMPYSLLTIY